MTPFNVSISEMILDSNYDQQQAAFYWRLVDRLMSDDARGVYVSRVDIESCVRAANLYAGEVASLSNLIRLAKLPRFNHAFDFAFEVITTYEDSEKVTGASLRDALIRRINTLSDSELVDACECYDTFEMES